MSSETIGSARSKPVSRITIAAIAVPMKPYRSVRMCWKLPSTFRLRRLARASIHDRGEVHEDAGQGDGEHQAAADMGGSNRRRIAS